VERRPADVTRIVHETKTRNSSSRHAKKKGERWYLGRTEFLPQPGANPAVPPPKGSVFVSVVGAQKVVEAFAPFKALRSLGKVPEARAAEFVFDKRKPRSRSR